MKNSAKLPFSLTAIAILIAAIASASAATLVNSNFTSVGLTSDQDIDVTGSNVVAWGYYDQSSDFRASKLRLSRASPPLMKNIRKILGYPFFQEGVFVLPSPLCKTIPSLSPSIRAQQPRTDSSLASSRQ